jgi:uncharacterized protein (TIRG00374 family)
MKLSRIFPLIGIFLFIYILLNIDVARTVEILSKADLLLIGLAFLVVSLNIVIKGLKWKMLVSLYDPGYPLWKCVKSWLMGFSISMVTPARIGDLSRAYYVKQKMGTGRGLMTVIFDRIIDIAILFTMGILGLLSLVSIFSQHADIIYMISGLFVLFILGVYLSTKKRVVKMFLRPLFSRFVPDNHKTNINLTFNDFYSGLVILRKGRRNIILAVSLGIAAWIITVFQCYLLSISIGLSVSYLFLLSVIPIIALMDTLPISFSGIGTRDAALVFFFSFLSIGKEYAISLSFLILIFGYVAMGLIGAALILKGHYK